MKSHPDRSAANLAQRSALLQDWTGAEADSDLGDARVDLQLLRFAVLQGLARQGTAEARARLSGLDSADLQAGRVQDGVARGYKVALEEAASLCSPPLSPADLNGHSPWQRLPDPWQDENLILGATSAKDLRKKRELLVASGGARIRFSRRFGILLVDRKKGVHQENCMVFEDRRDQGSLDCFQGQEGEKPRLFNPAFLQPTFYLQSPERDLLLLKGRLGPKPNHFPCQLVLEGRKSESGIRLTVEIENRQPNHRLRIRFLGLPEGLEPDHRGTPGWEKIIHKGHRILAATLVRACGNLSVDAMPVATPEAQLFGFHRHDFMLCGKFTPWGTDGIVGWA